jgi:hypothetical protein
LALAYYFRIQKRLFEIFGIDVVPEFHDG